MTSTTRDLSCAATPKPRADEPSEAELREQETTCAVIDECLPILEGLLNRITPDPSKPRTDEAPDAAVRAWADEHLPVRRDEEDFGDGPEGQRRREIFLAANGCRIHEDEPEPYDGGHMELALRVAEADFDAALDALTAAPIRSVARHPARVRRAREGRPRGRRAARRATSRGDPDDPEGDGEPPPRPRALDTLRRLTSWLRAGRL